MTTVEKLSSLNDEWSKCNNRISEIKKELKPLVIERLQQLNYKEEKVEIKVKVAPRKFEKKKIIRGFVSWTEFFKDEDTGEETPIVRHQIVMEDNDWFIGSFGIESLINWDE